MTIIKQKAKVGDFILSVHDTRSVDLWFNAHGRHICAAVLVIPTKVCEAETVLFNMKNQICDLDFNGDNLELTSLVQTHLDTHSEDVELLHKQVNVTNAENAVYDDEEKQ